MAPVHKRFGPESSPAPVASDSDSDPDTHELEQSYHTDASDASDSSDASNSDDDAPEAVSTSAALSASRSAQRKLAQTLSSQAAQAKSQRKQREANLLAQTKSRASSKRKLPAQTGVLESNSEEESAGEDEDRDDDEPIPLLPLDVLEAAERAQKLREEAEFRASIPASARKRKFLDATETRPAKDVRIGAKTAVRVLRKGPKALAPKARKESRNVRDAWLEGRRGRKGSGIGIGQRKGFGVGFQTK